MIELNNMKNPNELRLIPIRNVDRNYEAEFYIREGDSLILLDGTNRSRRLECEYIDPYHFSCGSSCFHVDEFAEMLKKTGKTVQPCGYETNLDAYRKIYVDRDLKDEAGKAVPYRAILSIGQESRYGRPEGFVTVCTQAEKNRQFCLYTKDKETGKPIREYHSIRDALANVLPMLDVPKGHLLTLQAVLLANDPFKEKISEAEYAKIGKDYKGVYEDYDGKHPEWKGRKTAFLPGHGTTLFIEGVSFEIVKGPTLSDKIHSAESRTAASEQTAPERKATLDK